MLKNKNLITIIALICAVISLIAAIFAIGAAGQLKNQLDKLTADYNVLAQQLGVRSDAVTLKSWTLTPTAWEDGTGADIAFTAVPESYHEGMSAHLNVCLGQEVNSVRCEWNGTAFAATVEVPAADGYTYICVIDGSEITLASPKNPVEYAAVYLESSLTSSCTLMVNSWEAAENTLTLTDAHAQANLPKLSTGGSEPEIKSAAIVMRLGTEEVSRKEIVLVPGEGEGSYELTLQNFTFALPAMEENDQVELWLEVVLSDGQELVSVTSGWYRSGDALYLVAG